MAIKIFIWIFYFGAFISILNFYLSSIRYPIYCLLRKKESYKFNSGIPLLGSLFNIISIITYWGTARAVLAFIFFLIDTGGFPWLIYSMAKENWWREEKDKRERKK